MKCTVLSFAAVLCVPTYAKCNADNCYRALFPCGNPVALGSAVNFCQSLTAGAGTPAVTPSRATSACGSGPARYSSACSCGPTCTTTSSSAVNTACPTPTALVPNGDFECPYNVVWDPEVPDTSAIWELRQPGNTGNFAFEAHLLSPPATPELGVSVRVTSKPFTVTPNVPYKLGFASWFDSLDSGFIGVMINGSPVYTVDARDKGAAGAWHDNTVSFTPTGSTVTLKFEFLFGNQHAPSVQRIDTVTFIPA
ncbi:hypothetical protein QBC37DRAFT_376902 [Rhypophila decipiens]|uniref:CBM-cenC domain-containing protein n=1 Tax=Rhypophila decipiens TaxID=261697 RepID=A0AAN6Y5M2_9PEZI|nr:hypothetical protein QBC37DRAFT_376902 [Rhypophila decipiens]